MQTLMTAEEKERLTARYISEGFTTMERLYQTMPFCMEYETTLHHKERYNELQSVFKAAKEKAALMDMEKDQTELAYYMMALADCCEIIDEEVFDHYKNLENAFKTVLHRLVPEVSVMKKQTKLMMADAILKACRLQMVLEEKYYPLGMAMLEEGKAENDD